jgi:ribosomal protein S18 acetylase RimI-like enzyme
MVQISKAASEADLIGIQVLQKANLKKIISELEATNEGFVTAEYSLELLKAMHKYRASVIAKDGDRVVGYALVTTKDIYGQHDLIDDLLNVLDKINFASKPLKETQYVLVGQLCVGKGYRGIGLVQKMYNYFKESYATEYEYLITDVADNNPRSLKAHIKSGFQIIHSINYDGVRWDIVLWDWNKNLT